MKIIPDQTTHPRIIKTKINNKRTYLYKNKRKILIFTGQINFFINFKHYFDDAEVNKKYIWNISRYINYKML